MKQLIPISLDAAGKIPDLSDRIIEKLFGTAAVLLNQYKNTTRALIFQLRKKNLFHVDLVDHKDQITHRFEIRITKEGSAAQTTKISLED